ncbi:MAG TPA: DUF2071 domain-containing protein, partial [Longimicrobiales bacterium]|nr:DUF2071 domain-containing protein [Longimicrobiales bacterium]
GRPRSGTSLAGHDPMTDTEAILGTVAHRPWPLPRGPWVLFQSWRDLLFAHWAVEPELLRPRVPPALELDLHDGRAWIGIAPFRIEGFRPRGLPSLGPLSAFPELNLRTYVRAGGQSGVFFFSLDAGSAAAVVGARTLFRLPYRKAGMEIRDDDGLISFRSARPDGAAAFRASYRPTEHAFEAGPSTLEHFLTERYVLFTVLRDGRVLKGDIHHRPWALQPAEGEVDGAALAAAENVPLPASEPLLHFSRRLDTLIWLPLPVKGAAGSFRDRGTRCTRTPRRRS